MRTPASGRAVTQVNLQSLRDVSYPKETLGELLKDCKTPKDVRSLYRRCCST